MGRGIFLLILVLFVLCFPSVFYAQMNSMDKFKMQQQADQIKSRYDQFKTQTQNASEETTEVFNKFAKKNQRPNIDSMIKLYGIPILIIAVIGVIFLIVWHQNI